MLALLTCTAGTCVTGGLTATFVWIALISFMILVFVVVCFVRITQKAGYSGWWAVLLFLPYIVGFLAARSHSSALDLAFLVSIPAPLVYLGWLAFAVWPSTTGPRRPAPREAYYAPDPYAGAREPTSAAAPRGTWPDTAAAIPLPPLPPPRTGSGALGPTLSPPPGAPLSGTPFGAPLPPPPGTVTGLSPAASAPPSPPPASPVVAPDGWYPSAAAPGQERYGAGGRWTDHFRPAPGGPAPGQGA